MVAALALFAEGQTSREYVEAVRGASNRQAMSILHLARDMAALGHVGQTRNLLARYVEIDGTPADIRRRARIALQVLSRSPD